MTSDLPSSFNLIAGALSIAASFAKIAIGYATASAEKRAELLAQAEQDFEEFVTLMQTFDEEIERINAEIDAELAKEK